MYLPKIYFCCCLHYSDPCHLSLKLNTFQLCLMYFTINKHSVTMTTMLLILMLLTFSDGQRKLRLPSTIYLILLLLSFAASESNLWGRFHFSPTPLQRPWFYQKLNSILCFQRAKTKQKYYEVGDIQ